jgi:hypothetical protein
VSGTFSRQLQRWPLNGIQNKGATEMSTREATSEDLKLLDVTELTQVGGAYDEINWCGTRYPGWHPPVPQPGPWFDPVSFVALNPQPLPPKAMGSFY